MLKPLISRLLPQVKAAQAEEPVAPVEPILFHYMMVSLTAALSEFGPEMRVTRRLSADQPEVVAAYWSLVEGMVFGARTPGSGFSQTRLRRVRALRAPSRATESPGRLFVVPRGAPASRSWKPTTSASMRARTGSARAELQTPRARRPATLRSGSSLHKGPSRPDPF